MTEKEHRFLHLAEILVQLAGSPVPSQQFQVLADYAEFVLAFDYLGVALLSPDDNGYLIHSLSGMGAGSVVPGLYAPDEGIVGRVLGQNRALVTADFTVLDIPQSPDFEGICARLGLRAAMVMPVRQDMKAIGALLFLARPPTVYHDADLEIGTRLAAGLSAALETARMYQVLADERSTLFNDLAQMKSDFVSTVSHDLKNPLSIINMAVDLMGIVGNLNKEQKELQNRVRVTTTHMIELVSALLDLGKIEAGIGQQAETFDLVILARTAVDDLKMNIMGKEQQVKLEMPQQAIITGDLRQLRQVFLNLVGNASKYTPVGGEIEVIIQVGENGAEVQVKDTGIGIPEIDLPYIFDKFYRVDNGQTKVFKGTGLGLAITKGVIEAHGGRISVASHLGQGSQFTFRLPQ